VRSRIVASPLISLLIAVLVVSLAATLPLSGCRPKPQPSAASGQEPGGSGSGGGQPSGSGGSSQPPGGQGETARWALYRFRPGQFYRYEVKVVNSGGATTGWFSLGVSDAGGGQLTLAYQGSFAGRDFSASATVSSQAPVDGLIAQMNPMASICVLPMFLTPWPLFFADAEWATGASWSYTHEGDTLTFRVTGQESYAGVSGYVGEWDMNGQTVASFCVSPEVPLVLHSRIGEDNDCVEYTLVEINGF